MFDEMTIERGGTNIMKEQMYNNLGSELGKKVLLMRHQILKYAMLSIVVFYFGISEINAATIQAASCSRSDVGSAISASTYGDTVVVPSGSCTWSSTLEINKGITFQGAGVGNTVITIGTGGSLIYYNPDTTRNDPFRITGFTFDLNDTAQIGGYLAAIVLGENKAPPFTVQTKVRVDNNRFHNGASTYQSIRLWGVQGVIDNNVFEDVGQPFRAEGSVANSNLWWDNVNYEFGANQTTSDGTMWVEDNTININAGSNVMASCQSAGRYSFRYNNIITAGSSYPLIDLHGPQGYDCFGAEVYGNFVNPSSTGNEVRLVDQRGGKVLIFYNYVDAAANIQVRSEEAAQSTTNLQPTTISDSYYWGSRKFGGALITASIAQVFDGNPVEDTDFFQDQAGFDGTSGVGMGTLAARPSTCTTGVGYWATTQSTTDLTGMVGKNPSTPIAGTLYKCTATDTWTAFFTPLVYPHPLTGDTLAPVPPTNLQAQ